jgi:hypothetical protein
VLDATKYDGPYAANCAVKHEPGSRNRLIVSTPTELYLRDAALLEPLERSIYNPQTTLFMDTSQMLRFKKSRGTYLNLLGASNPTDLKSCEAQQSPFLILQTLKVVFKLAHRVFPNAVDLQDLTDTIQKSYTSGGIIKFKERFFLAIQGNPSGIRFTQWFNTVYNNIQQIFTNNVLQTMALPQNQGLVGTGDDSDSANASVISIITSKMIYNSANFRIALKNDWIGIYITEFLRYVHNQNGFFGYPARILRAINYSNPYHNVSELEVHEELEARLDTFMTYSSRAMITFPFTDLYYDLRQFFISKSILSLTIDEVFSLVHTPRSQGGFGILPFYPYHPKFNYAFPRRLIITTSQPPPIEKEYPLHYTRFFDKIFAKTGFKYKPSKKFNGSFFLNFRPRVTKVEFRDNDPSLYQLLPWYSHQLVSQSVDEYWNKLTIYSPPKDILLTSEFSDSPFWSDIYLQFARHKHADLLFPHSEKFFRYKEMFRGKDLSSIMQFGIPYASLSTPQLNASFISGLSQSITNFLIDTYLNSPIYYTKNFLPQLQYTVEHSMSHYIFKKYNSDPYYYGH